MSRSLLIAALRRTTRSLSFTLPKELFHETLLENMSSIKNEGLTPRVGSVVKEGYGSDGDMPDPDGAIFLSDEKEGLGYYIAWQISNSIDTPIDDITWTDMKEYGLLTVLDTSKHRDTLCPIYRLVDDDLNVINLDGEEVEYLENAEGDDIHIENMPHSIEKGDWFSLACVFPTKYIHGDDLVKYLKKNSKNHLIKDMKP